MIQNIAGNSVISESDPQIKRLSLLAHHLANAAPLHGSTIWSSSTVSFNCKISYLMRCEVEKSAK